MAKRFTRNIKDITNVPTFSIDHTTQNDLVNDAKNVYVNQQKKYVKITHQIDTLSSKDKSVTIGDKDTNDNVDLSVYTGYVDNISSDDKSIIVSPKKDVDGKMIQDLSVYFKPIKDLIAKKQDKLIARDGIKIDGVIISTIPKINATFNEAINVGYGTFRYVYLSPTNNFKIKIAKIIDKKIVLIDSHENSISNVIEDSSSNVFLRSATIEVDHIEDYNPAGTHVLVAVDNNTDAIFSVSDLFIKYRLTI